MRAPRGRSRTGTGPRAAARTCGRAPCAAPWPSSGGSVTSTSRASRALRRPPACSAAFHSAARSRAPARVSPPGELGSQHDLLVQDVLASGVVVDLARPLVADTLARPVRRRSRDAAPLASREDLDVEEVLGHRAVLSHAQQLPPPCLPKEGESSNPGALRSRLFRDLARSPLIDSWDFAAGTRPAGIFLPLH